MDGDGANGEGLKERESARAREATRKEKAPTPLANEQSRGSRTGSVADDSFAPRTGGRIAGKGVIVLKKRVSRSLLLCQNLMACPTG